MYFSSDVVVKLTISQQGHFITFIKIDMNLITKCNPRDKRKFPSFSSQVNNNNNHHHLHHSNNNNKNNATTTTTTASITEDMHFSSVFAYFVYISVNIPSYSETKQCNFHVVFRCDYF